MHAQLYVRVQNGLLGEHVQSVAEEEHNHDHEHVLEVLRVALKPNNRIVR